MNSSRRRLAAILEALGVPPSARRSAATPAAPACESLEGRQLLAGGLGFPGMGMGMADVAGRQGFVGQDSSSTQGTSRFGPGDWGGQDSMRDATSATVASASTTTAAASTTASTTAQDPSAMSIGRFGGQDASMGRADLAGMSSFDPSSNQSFSMIPPGQFGGGFGGGDFGGGFGARDAMGSARGLGGTPSADQTQLQTDLTTLQTDSQAIHDKSQVTPAMEAVVQADLKAIKGAETTTPAAAAQATLQADTKAAQANAGGPTDAQVAQIQLDQDAIYVSQGVNTALVTKLDTDRAAIKTASGVTAADEATLAADRAAVKADYAKLAPATTTDPSGTTSATPALTAAAAAMPTTPPASTPAAATTAATPMMPATPATPAVVAATATPVAPTTPALPTTPAATAPATMTPMTAQMTQTTPVVPAAQFMKGGHEHHARIAHGHDHGHRA